MCDKQTEDRPLSRFEKLPNEIFTYVLEDLCHHCNDRYPESPTGDLVRDSVALLSLARTSRRCRSIALPFLFHGFYDCDEAKYIFKMLNWHPDLAGFTRAISLPFESSLRNYPLVERTANRLSVADLKAVDYALIKDHSSLEASLAFTLCSKVERLQIRLDTLDRSRASFKNTFYLFREISKKRRTPALLPSLEYLEVRTGLEPTDGIVASGVPLILEFTPRLEVLVLRGRDGFKIYNSEKGFFADKVRPALESLVEIQMIGWDLTRRNSDSYVLKEFLAATKRLRTFKYLSSVKKPSLNSVWDVGLFHHEYPPQHLVNMLLRVKSTLQHLTLDFGERGLEKEPNSPDTHDIIIDCGQLKEFTHLETLEIDQFCYCPHQIEGLNRDIERNTYLADMLPTTVRKLTISFPRYRGGYRCRNCIMHLGQRVVVGDFPLLQHVEINARVATPKYDPNHVVSPMTLVDDPERDISINRREIEKSFMGSSVVVKYRFWAPDNGKRYR